ncbi:NAD(P)/FAD-dependent oxidoreductase [Tropicimonas sediminicola]|uniref:3-phenylpropionate/trans-cinnamate dioxygenase ferredoxin reductase subunit n=1 Tax=Tropicimonas sediminicola TaxID=1031541 RepID=A0A239J005_9RHOB|nr:FAD-dependent oxidoreductase [Tropicimonas sediminicola]SNS98798.1 3-phenylpropionate/trans-cinnamate dioxygenase ferredoxin reductase subunit [Tropicimonas sediminicola]
MAEMVIIGAGECGVRAAFSLREHGHAGRITLIGAESSLPYERPPLSKGMGAAKPIRPEEAYDEAGISLMRGAEVSRIDRDAQRVRLGNGESLPYDRLLLATGARARLFPSLQGCLTLRTDRDAAALLPRLTPDARIGIIGGGFIGLELAATARSLGARVTVIEAAPRLLARAVPAEIAAVVEARHRAEGVDLRIGTGVANATGETITLADGATHAFDAVIAGVGSVPNTELAEQAGLTVENGVRVDSRFRTPDPAIFAAGDCCSFEWRGARLRLESWKAAQDQGAFATACMLGCEGEETYGSVPWFWSDQYDLTLQVAGLFDPARPVHQRSTGDGQCVVFQCDPGNAPAAAAGIGPGNAVARDIRIFEKLIERGVPVEPDVLADPSQNLKRLLRAA